MHSRARPALAFFVACSIASRGARHLWLFGVLLIASAAAFAQVAVPALRSPVTDLTATLSAEQAAALEQRLRAFETAKGSQIAVLLVPTTQPETVEQYSIRVAEAWKLGRRGVDDGVLLVVAKDDRAVRIEVGYGLEGALPDALANRITDQVIVPYFRNGDFYGGVTAAVERIIAVIEGEPLPENLQRQQQAPQGFGSALPIFLMLVFVISGMLRRMFGTVGGALFTGGGAGALVWILTSVAGVAIGAAVIAFIFSIFSGAGGGRGWTSSRRGGGFGGWGGGGGFGGGGWSGGGGGFGGGGASGRW